jgi:hypothetical protein
MPRQMIDHLRNREGALGFADTKTLLVERDTEWKLSKVQQLYFSKVEKAMRGLTRAGINSDPNELRDMALFYLKITGKFDAAIHEWEAKPLADKTWANIKSFISTKYAKGNKQTKLKGKQFKANTMEEQAKATKEHINALTENHMCQMETLIRSTTEAMKEMMTLVKIGNTNSTNANNRTDEKKTYRQEKTRKKSETHLYANIATENTQINWKLNAGNLNPTHHSAQPGGSLTKAPKGTQGRQ